jgi:hypothetical protein
LKQYENWPAQFFFVIPVQKILIAIAVLSETFLRLKRK